MFLANPCGKTRHYIALRPLITRSNMAMMAITSNTWIMPPVKKPPKKLTAQMMTRITAMIYRRLPMAVSLKEK